MVVSWILNTIEPTIKSTITYSERCDELWSELKELFSKKNGPRQNKLISALSNCKHAGLIVSEYYAKLKLLWDELAGYKQLTAYNRGMQMELIK